MKVMLGENSNTPPIELIVACDLKRRIEKFGGINLDTVFDNGANGLAVEPPTLYSVY
jgi:hypothetical protein